VADVRDPKWLAHFIQTPEKVTADGDPIAVALFEKYKQIRMPNLRLSDEDTADLIDFIKRQSKDPEGKLAQANNSKPQNQELRSHHEAPVEANTTSPSASGTTAAAEKGKN
jgi:hypothetical protein